MIQGFYEEDHHDYQEGRIKNALEEIIQEETLGVIFLVKYTKQVAGYFILAYGWSLEYSGRDLFIDELYINKNFRGLGLGKKSLEFIEQFVKDRKIKAIHLEVNKFSIAKKLYESKGYISHNSDLMSRRF
jgi:GNAT superfamily N-acetyltransferase